MTDTKPIKDFSLIVAMERLSRGIGFKGTIPWNIPADREMFRKITTFRKPESMISDPLIENVVVMGRKTWESFPGVLPGRLNIVISENQVFNKVQGVKMYSSLREALEDLSANRYVDEIFVAGGERLYKDAMEMKECTKLYVTVIDLEKTSSLDFDTFFPSIPTNYMCTQISAENKKSELSFHYCLWRRKSSMYEENQYLSTVAKVLSNGEDRKDRTAVGSLSIFGNVMRFDISDRFPLLTTKKMFWKGIVAERLWINSGSSDSTALEDLGVNIWKNDTSLENFEKLAKENELKGRYDLEKVFRSRKRGDVGPLYGHTLRHFGAKYRGCNVDYSGQGFDQLSWLINEIKNNPSSRRLMFTHHDPASAEECVLNACHVIYQFRVSKGSLSCFLFQRSCDLGLGAGFNIASAALLTYQIAHVCHLKPKELVYVTADTHVYKNHVEPLSKQLKREPYKFPRLTIKREVENIDDFKIDDFVLEEYQSHTPIQMDFPL